jgi:hypothetical protein
MCNAWLDTNSKSVTLGICATVLALVLMRWVRVMNRRSARCMNELVRVPNVIGTPPNVRRLCIACLRSE